MKGPDAGSELSIVVPTLNEVGNVRCLVQRLDAALPGLAWEVVFVDDDSTDGTTEALRELTRSHPRVRLVHRIGRRGLASAVVEGILSTSSPYVAVMDADLQHDETVLPRMLEALKRGDVDVAVASRYTEGGGIGDWDRRRARASRAATRLARLVLRADLSDPMSGYFAIRRTTFDSAVRRLSVRGYKILFDLFASLPMPPRFVEIPYTFRTRHSGVSKLDALVTWDCLMLMLDKQFGHVVPARLLVLGLVGGAGIATHLLSLWLRHRVGHAGLPSVRPSRP